MNILLWIIVAVVIGWLSWSIIGPLLEKLGAFLHRIDPAVRRENRGWKARSKRI